MSAMPEEAEDPGQLSRQFKDEIEQKEKKFCKLLNLKHSAYAKTIPEYKARVGLMTLFDFYKTKLKVFKETPKYFSRLEWGIKYHFLGTARQTLRLARRMELTETEIHALTISAFFHDIAKIKYDNDFFIRKLSRPDHRILNHSIESFQLMTTYCGYFNCEILMGILQHHEYYDGHGYPLQLKGDQIHLFARVISLTDSYSAMMESREFSTKKETVRDVLEEIDACRHSQFDPDIAELFIKSRPGSISRGLSD